MARDITTVITVDELDLQLWVVTDLLKLRSLHFGYWEKGAAVKLDLEDVRQAQARYTEELITGIPAGIKTILDVGCGIGDNALALSQRGYAVTAISPDRNHGKFFNGNGHHAVHFCNQKFEDFRSDSRFDLVLMSESQNYFDAGTAFTQCRQLLQPGGCVLVCGTFRKKPTSEFAQIRNVYSDFLEQAGAHGFELLESVDITNNVLPTLQLMNQAFAEYVEPYLAAFPNHVGRSLGWKAAVAKLLFAKELKHLKSIFRYYEEFAQPARFQSHACYVRLLFRSRRLVD